MSDKSDTTARAFTRLPRSRGRAVWAPVRRRNCQRYRLGKPRGRRVQGPECSSRLLGCILRTRPILLSDARCCRRSGGVDRQPLPATTLEGRMRTLVTALAAAASASPVPMEHARPCADRRSAQCARAPPVDPHSSWAEPEATPLLVPHRSGQHRYPAGSRADRRLRRLRDETSPGNDAGLGPSRLLRDEMQMGTGRGSGWRSRSFEH